MKYLRTLSLTIVFMLLLFNGVMVELASAMGTSQTPEVKLGLLLPLGTTTGDQMRKSSELALSELNEKFKGKIQFVGRWEDSRSDPAAASTRMEELAADKEVMGVMGPVDSGPAVAAMDVANRYGLVLISPLASSMVLAIPGDYFFRTWPPDAADASCSSQYAVESLGKKEAVMLFIGATYGQGLAEAFAQDFERRGGNILDSIEYPPDTQTFSSIVKRVISHSPQLLYFVGYPPDMAEVLRELRSKNIGFPVISSAVVSDPSVVQLAGENVEGVVFPFPTTFDASSDLKESKRFLESYKNKFGEEPSFVAAQAYDSVNILSQAIITAMSEDKSTLSRKSVKRALETMGTYVGATGELSFDKNGDAIRKFKMYEIRNGKISPLN